VKHAATPEPDRAEYLSAFPDADAACQKWLAFLRGYAERDSRARAALDEVRHAGLDRDRWTLAVGHFRAVMWNLPADLTHRRVHAGLCHPFIFGLLLRLGDEAEEQLVASLAGKKPWPDEWNGRLSLGPGGTTLGGLDEWPDLVTPSAGRQALLLATSDWCRKRLGEVPYRGLARLVIGYEQYPRLGIASSAGREEDLAQHLRSVARGAAKKNLDLSVRHAAREYLKRFANGSPELK
jgi:hypothetical protein